MYAENDNEVIEALGGPTKLKNDDSRVKVSQLREGVDESLTKMSLLSPVDVVGCVLVKKLAHFSSLWNVCFVLLWVV